MRIRSNRLLPGVLLASLAASGCSTMTVATHQSVDVTAQSANASTQATRASFNATTDSTRDTRQATYRSSLAFVRTNMQPIRREAARGYGDNVTALAALLHVSHRQAFARWMQRNYQPLFSDVNGPGQLLKRIYARRGMTLPAQSGRS